MWVRLVCFPSKYVIYIIFAQYVEQEGGRSMLQLWVAVSNFRQQLIEEAPSYDPMQAQTDAMILYDKWGFGGKIT